jgi:Ulp1 family protease
MLTCLCRPVEFPPAGRRRATVPFSDLERLDDGQFLNDALIEFYMLYVSSSFMADDL